MARLYAGGAPKMLGRRIEIDAMRADGTEFPVELTITRLAGDGPPLFTAHLRDITERKLAEAERSGVALVGGSAFGRSRHNKLVFFDGDGEELQGSTVTVKVDRVHAYSLFGEMTGVVKRA